MTIAHHPSAESLMALACGTLLPGPRLVVRVHLSSCPECRERLREMEVLGGLLLEAAPPVPLGTNALERIFARIDAEASASRDLAPRDLAPRDLASAPRPERAPPVLSGGIALPAELAGHRIGRWRFITPSFKWSRVTLADAPEANVILLRFAAGSAAPRHGHRGREYTQVLHGRFSDADGQYGPGDLTEADENVDHQPIVDADGDCLCLAALEAPIRIHSFLGRLVQPLIGL